MLYYKINQATGKEHIGTVKINEIDFNLKIKTSYYNFEHNYNKKDLTLCIIYSIQNKIQQSMKKLV